MKYLIFIALFVVATKQSLGQSDFPQNYDVKENEGGENKIIVEIDNIEGFTIIERAEVSLADTWSRPVIGLVMNLVVDNKCLNGELSEGELVVLNGKVIGDNTLILEAGASYVEFEPTSDIKLETGQPVEIKGIIGNDH